MVKKKPKKVYELLISITDSYFLKAIKTFIYLNSKIYLKSSNLKNIWLENLMN